MHKRTVSITPFLFTVALLTECVAFVICFVSGNMDSDRLFPHDYGLSAFFSNHEEMDSQISDINKQWEAPDQETAAGNGRTRSNRPGILPGKRVNSTPTPNPSKFMRQPACREANAPLFANQPHEIAAQTLMPQASPFPPAVAMPNLRSPPRALAVEFSGETTF